MSRRQTTARPDDPGFAPPAPPARPEPARPSARPAATAPDPVAPIAPVTCPEIRRLARAECLAVLRRNSVGRLAFAFARQVEVLPVHYVVEDGWLYGRTSPGCTMDVWRRNHWVALEVDEMRAPVDWTSVVAYGALYLLRPDAARAEAATWQRAVELLRRLMPGTGSAYDPVPHRSLVFRMRAREVHGRATAPPPA